MIASRHWNKNGLYFTITTCPIYQVSCTIFIYGIRSYRKFLSSVYFYVGYVENSPMFIIWSSWKYWVEGYYFESWSYKYQKHQSSEHFFLLGWWEPDVHLLSYSGLLNGCILYFLELWCWGVILSLYSFLLHTLVAYVSGCFD